ncbi:hypothetical protein HDZ31DRAFT_13764, partial [Schizophyllum fasciatum]
IATIGTIHNCAAHQCTVSATRVQKVERQEIEEMALEIAHNVPEDLVINLAQLRSASFL